LWREALLAQAVLMRKTRGYRHHPQLERFEASSSPVGMIAEYLRAVCAEAAIRGYRFDSTRISRPRCVARLRVTLGQLEYEWAHLLKKLEARDPLWCRRWTAVGRPLPHPLFRVRPGGVAGWERVPSNAGGSTTARNS